MESQDKFNDGKWHTLSANRVNKDGLLKVDNIQGMVSEKGDIPF